MFVSISEMTPIDENMFLKPGAVRIIRRIIKKKITQANVFITFCALSEAKGMDIKMSERKKICILATADLPIPPVKGGAVETLVQAFLEYNDAEGIFDIEVISIYDELAKECSKRYYNTNFVFIRVNSVVDWIYRLFVKVQRHVLPSKIIALNCFHKKAIQMINMKNYDLIIEEAGTSYIEVIKKQTNRKIILHLHSDDLYKDAKNAKRIADSCCGIIAVSNYIRNRVLTVKSEKEKVITVHNFVDDKIFSKKSNDNEIEKRKKKFGIEKDDFTIIFVGRVIEAKGVRELVKAILQINCKDIKLLIVGASFFEDSKKTPYIEEIRKMARTIKSQIIFTGYINHNELYKAYEMADLCVIPSICEDAAPLVLLEAMAMGLPIIATNSGGIPEVLSNSGGVIVEKSVNGLPDALKSAIVDIKENYQTRNIMGCRNLEMAKQYSKKHFCENLTSAINQFL